MHIDPIYFRDHVIAPVLKGLDLWSPVAEKLLLATAIHESGLRYRVQIGGGPARGLFQMERRTHDDIWDTYLRFRRVTAHNVLKVSKLSHPPDANELISNDEYACAMARVLYYRSPKPLPGLAIEELAQYWGQIYQTTNDPVKKRQFIADWRRMMGE